MFTMKIFRLAALLLLLAQGGWAADVVILNRPHSDFDPLDQYSTQLLQHALARTVAEYGPYEIRTSGYVMERGQFASSPASTLGFRAELDRMLIELKRGELINVTAQPTRPEWEAQLIPVRIPLDKGLFSYRISLIRQEDQAKFAAIRSLEELKRQPLGISPTWTVHRIFKQAGFNLVEGFTYDGLFEMLRAGRFSHLSRALYEAPLEFESRKGNFPELAIEKHLMLYFPLPRYFFVSPKHPKLAERIERGLNLMIRDGSFDQIFLDYHRPLLEQTGFCQRRIFRLDNPFLNQETPLGRKELWLDATPGKKGSICPASPARKPQDKK